MEKLATEHSKGPDHRGGQRASEEGEVAQQEVVGGLSVVLQDPKALHEDVACLGLRVTPGPGQCRNARALTPWWWWLLLATTS